MDLWWFGLITRDAESENDAVRMKNESFVVLSVHVYTHYIWFSCSSLFTFTLEILLSAQMKLFSFWRPHMLLRSNGEVAFDLSWLIIAFCSRSTIAHWPVLRSGSHGAWWVDEISLFLPNLMLLIQPMSSPAYCFLSSWALLLDGWDQQIHPS